MTVPADHLREMADWFDRKQDQYGPLYKNIGEFMFNILGPMELKTAEDFGRYYIWSQVLNKLLRYSRNFKTGGHEDSLNDLSIYSMMLRELDKEFAEGKTFANIAVSKRPPEIPELDHVATTMHKFTARSE